MGQKMIVNYKRLSFKHPTISLRLGRHKRNDRNKKVVIPHDSKKGYFPPFLVVGRCFMRIIFNVMFEIISISTTSLQLRVVTICEILNSELFPMLFPMHPTSDNYPVIVVVEL